MIDFHDITVRDQRWIEPILHAANKPGADYTFTSMLFWPHNPCRPWAAFLIEQMICPHQFERQSLSKWVKVWQKT